MLIISDLTSNIFHDKKINDLLDIFKHYQYNDYKSFKIFYSGGEPTYWENLIPLTEHLKDYLGENLTVAVNTNLSRPLKYWQDNYMLFDDIVASFHIEFCKKQRYIAADGSTIVYESDTGTTPISTPGDQWLVAEANSDGYGKNIFTLGEKPGIDTLMDLYLSMRYRKKGDQELWSDWSKPQLAEGWIKRVLAGINPFNQRSKDLFNNQANLDYSMLTQAGKRWEGDVALSLSSINDFGLIEIYETVLNKAKNISINAGINHNGANQALLLAAGYLNDLYMMVGNDAYADAYNPTIGFSTSDGGEYGDFSTALFAFKGQLATLLDEELSLLRGRDDFKAPGVEANPVYNRLFWNYTRGIDSGEVIYALNYNIQEREGENLDGNVDAADAAHMYPMGHGDAFGHYMTAIKGYYKLLADTDFTCVPQS